MPLKQMKWPKKGRPGISRLRRLLKRLRRRDQAPRAPTEAPGNRPDSGRRRAPPPHRGYSDDASAAAQPDRLKPQAFR